MIRSSTFVINEYFIIIRQMYYSVAHFGISTESDPNAQFILIRDFRIPKICPNTNIPFIFPFQIKIRPIWLYKPTDQITHHFVQWIFPQKDRQNTPYRAGNLWPTGWSSGLPTPHLSRPCSPFWRLFFTVFSNKRKQIIEAAFWRPHISSVDVGWQFSKNRTTIFESAFLIDISKFPFPCQVRHEAHCGTSLVWRLKYRFLR